ncbi:hypothetical protein BG011_006036, partial [Mortierella polycephala]
MNTTSFTTSQYHENNRDSASSCSHQGSSEQYDENATICAIETFAEHWTEAQAFSVATLAACAITALESSHIDTLPWKYTFLRSLFRQLGIHSRAEQEMLMSLQENGSYQDCNTHVLAEPLLPRMLRTSYEQPSPQDSPEATSPISSSPPSPNRTRRSLQQPCQYGQPSSDHGSPLDPEQGHGQEQGQNSDSESESELDIRTEIINDLLYIGLGFEPSSKRRGGLPIQAMSQDLVGLDLDLPPGYSEKDDLYTISATDSNERYDNLAEPVTQVELPLTQHNEKPQHQLQQLGTPGLPPRLTREPSSISSFSSSSTSTSTSSASRKRRARVQPLEYDARARALIFTMCNYLLLSYESFMMVEKRIAQHLYFYQQELIEAEKVELEQEKQRMEEQQRLERQRQQEQVGSGAGARVGAFFSNLRGNRNSHISSRSTVTNDHGAAMQSQAQSSMQELERKKKTWKYIATGLSIAAGATVIGLTGGLAAPLVAVGAGVLLGSGAAILGSTAGIAVMASLFGLAGGGLAGYKMHRRTKDLKELSFTPIVKDPTLPQIPSLHLAIAVSGYLFNESEVIDAWQGTAEHALEGQDVFHLTFEPAELVTLGNAFKVFVTTEAVRMVSTQVIQQTVFAALASALVLPLGLMRAGDLIDNP